VVYFDTSFLTPLFLEEPTSEAVEQFIAGLPVAELSTSHWARVEFSSLLAREVRMGGLSEAEARSADVAFEETIRESFHILTPTADDFDRAKVLLARPRTGLRAGDAMHLAMASQRAIDVIYSLDRGLLKAGALLNVTASDASVLPDG
jgi:predicted nucleic acid-binding protein